MVDRFSTRGLLATLLVTTALASPGLALAQQAAPVAQDETAEIDEIVVTGQRAAQRAAIAVKRNEFEVMDVISSDDIGKLPDHNTAAALRRIPGVSVQEDQGEPRFPVLRGLTSTYNRTTVDGAIVASVDEAARTVPLDIVPSVMAGQVQVIKTVTPENDGNAIGGVINITTRSAFDAGRPFFNGMASYGWYERQGDVRNDDPSYRLSFATGRTFGANEWGLVIGASHEQLDYDIPQVEAADPSVREYTAAGVPTTSGSSTGNGFQVPTQVRLFWYNNTKTRDGVNGKLEWRPNADFHWEASGLWAHMEDDEERIEYRVEPIGNVSAQTATGGTFGAGRGIIGLNQPITKREISLARTAFRWDANDQWLIDGSLVYSHAKLEVPNTSVTFTTRDAQAANYGFSYDTSNFFPVFTPTGPGLRNPASYFLTQYRDSLVQTFENTAQAGLNAAFDDGGADRNLKAKFGLALRTSDRDYQNARTDWALPSFNFDLVDRPGPTELIQGGYALGNRIDVEATEAYFNANRGLFARSVAARTGDYEVSEDVSAAYGQASYRVGAFTALAGVRYEKTEVSSDAFQVRTTPARPATPTAPAVPAVTTVTPIQNAGDYDNWLPSVHLRWDVMENLTVRAAWTNTIGRPNFASLAGAENVTFDGSQPVLSRGNPDLKPRESEGFDLSVEYYPRDGLVSLAVFSKDIENEIFTLTSFEQLDVGAGPQSVRVTTPRNAQSAEIYGIELAFQQELYFLPAPFDGFGVSANATFLDTDFVFLTNAGTVERHRSLFLQPGTTTNASIYYQRGPFEAKVSHNYIGGFLETVNDTIPNADQYWKGRHLYDASVSWRFDQGVTVFFEAQNLSDSGRQENTGPGARFLQESAEYGRTFWLGASVSF